MENQHRKISGYRELSQEEIDLMNRIKAKGSELMELYSELDLMLNRQHASKRSKVLDEDPRESDKVEYDRFLGAEPHRWACIGKTDIQTGIMALVRAVAQPDGV